MTARGPLPPINFAALGAALLQRAHTLVPLWLSGGALRGHEWVCGSLSGGAGTSCSVNLNTGKWSDFATSDKGGDLVGLYAAVNELEMGRAAVQVAREESLEDVAGVQRSDSAAPPPAPRPAPPVAQAAPARTFEGWRTLMPVPANAPPVNFAHQYRAEADIEHLATYQVDAHLMGYVARFRTSAGGKDPIPRTWCVSARDGAAKWHWRTWDEPRPLYFPAHTMPGPRTVIVVEGEKKADVLQAFLDAHAPGVYLVCSWPGGSGVWAKACWDWLKGCIVLLWPDCDAKHVPLTKKEREQYPNEEAQQLALAAKPLQPPEKQPGMKAMLGIGALLAGTHACTVQILPIPAAGSVVDGWDCADAIGTDGWDCARVLEFFGQAQALPPAAGDAPAPAATSGGGGGGGGDGGEKIDRSAAAEGGDGDKPMPRWLSPFWDTEKKRWLVSRKLVIRALENDPLLRDVLGYNELTNNIEALIDWPWLHGRLGPLTNSVDLLAGNYLSDTYGMPAIARAALTEAIETVAHKRPFHPVRQWLGSLKWDGKVRRHTWLAHVLGEKTGPTPAEAKTGTAGGQPMEYLAAVGCYWLLAMVYRVMEPGCKFDYMPVLEGPGGVRKSTMAEIMAGGATWYSATHFELGRGNSGSEQMQGLRVYEFAELANFNTTDIRLIKAFITDKVDRYRPSYGRTVEAFPRQLVMVGTTNERQYLRDRTGNRRFWPIKVLNTLNTEWLQERYDQLFAEAYQCYLAKERYAPTPDEEALLFVPQQDMRLVETSVITRLMYVLSRPAGIVGIEKEVNDLTDFLTMDLLTQALGVTDASKATPQLESQIRSYLEAEGWERVKRQRNGMRSWGYQRPPGWPQRDYSEDGRALVPASTSEPLSAAVDYGGDDERPF